MKDAKPLELDEAQLDDLQRNLAKRELSDADYELLKVLIDTFRSLSLHYQRAKTSMKRVLKMIFGASTEKTDSVLKRDPKKAPAPAGPKPKRKGHGRLGAADYPGAERVHIPHELLRPGQQCPDCIGRLRDAKRPSIVLRFCAQPVIKATAYVLEQLRCALCGKTFTAPPPPEAGTEKYDDNVAPMVGVLRYGFGMPMNRQADQQKMFGVPLPVGTQWGLLKAYQQEIGPMILPVWVRQAATGSVFHNDDTNGRVLELEKEIRTRRAEAKPGEKLRTGVFTTGVVAILKDGHKIALYTTGRQHAGENLQDVLDHRPSHLPAPIQMCDGLSRNEPQSDTLKANCNSHGRREFVDIADHFQPECEYVLETFKLVYKHEAAALDQKLSPEQRLFYHQQNSAEPMERLRLWMEQKLNDHQVEPNSALGSAFHYVLKRWGKLTLFLNKAGAPLDNNLCERILKTSIRHRDNSLFYKTMNDAKVGDFFMSVIQTCRLCGKDAFDYLTTLKRFAQQVRKDPSAWMPWNYQATAAGPPAT